MEANTRFPHRIVVTRETVTDSYPPTRTVAKVFESECRIFPSKSGGSSTTDGVVVSDYTASIPYHEVEIRTGDAVEATDRVRTFRGTVVASYNGNLGANLWFNEVKN